MLNGSWKRELGSKLFPERQVFVGLPPLFREVYVNFYLDEHTFGNPMKHPTPMQVQMTSIVWCAQERLQNNFCENLFIALALGRLWKWHSPSYYLSQIKPWEVSPLRSEKIIPKPTLNNILIFYLTETMGVWYKQHYLFFLSSITLIFDQEMSLS